MMMMSMMKIFMMKKMGWGTFALVIFIGIFSPAFGDEFDALADQVQGAYEKTQDLAMKFIQQTYVAVLEKEVSKNGEARFKKPGKFFIAYAGDRGRHYQSDGEKLWIYQRGDSQVQIHSLNDENVPAEALSFLGGLGNLKRDFAVEAVGKEKWDQLKSSKGELHWLELTPLKKRSQIQWMVMGFDPKTYLAKEVFLFTESGNLSHYRFEDIRSNTGITDKEFKYISP